MSLFFIFPSRILPLALFFLFVWSIRTTTAFSLLSSSLSVIHAEVAAPAEVLPALHADDIPFLLLADDIGAAVAAAMLVSPLVAAVDKAITLNAAGQEDLWTSLRTNILDFVTTNPIDNMLLSNVNAVPFRWLWFVYAVTYTAANTADTISTEVLHMNPAIPVLIASTTLNTVACVAKDAAFAKMYGKKQNNNNNDNNEEDQEEEDDDEEETTSSRNSQQKQVPAASYAVWLVRDILTAFSAFTLPPLLMDNYNVPALWSRLAGPVVAQYITTPLHLSGLAFYNLPAAETNLSVLVETVQTQFPATVVARQLRILPAFSLGGIANSALREWAHHNVYNMMT